MPDIVIDSTQQTLGIVYSRKITLTNAQIKALHSAPMEIIPAQGVGKGVFITSSFVFLNNSAGFYANVSDAGWIFTTVDDTYLSLPVKVDGKLGSADIYAIPFVFPNANMGAGVFANMPITFPYPTSVIDNLGIVLRDDFASEDYTGGNEANTLKITVYYTIIDL